MRWVVPLLCAALLVQSSVLSIWFRQSVIPDLALILVVLYAGLRGWRRGLASGLIGGFLESVISAAPLGVHLFRLAAVGVGVGLSGQGFEHTSPLLPPALVAVATFGGALLATLSLQAAGWVVPFSGLAAGDLVLQAGLNALLSVVFLPVIRQLLAARAPAEQVPG